MRNLIPVENDTSLARDPNSNAILVVDKSKLQRYKRQMSAMEGKETKINMLNDRIEKLEQLINDLLNKNE
jgi:hypothetical protein